LAGWKLDINSESRVAEMWKNAINSLGKIEGVGDIMIDTLYKYGFRSARDVMMADIEVLTEVPGIGGKLAEKMQRSAAKVVSEEEEGLRAEADAHRAEAEASELGYDGEQQLFAEIRGIGDKTVEQLAEGGYFTIMQVHQEANIVKLGEVTGIGIKKARQVKQAIATYLEEQARAAILPDVEPAEEVEAGDTPGELPVGEMEQATETPAGSMESAGEPVGDLAKESPDRSGTDDGMDAE
jgi:N utilization substance protein A